MRCKICSSDSSEFAAARIISKYDIRYYKCRECGFIQTEEPYWLDEAYNSAIASSDVGAVGRACSLAQTTSRYISLLFNSNGSFLDFGAGHGMFVRIMRDRGYDFYWCDKYAKNIFACGFDSLEGGAFELVTAFEVFEHFPDPLEEMEKLLQRSSNLLISTLLTPPHSPLPNQWPYFALESGQHISFYTLESLEIMAKKAGLFLHSSGGYLHLFTRRRISATRFRFLTNKFLWKMIKAAFAKKSLQDEDFRKLTNGLYNPY